ncbi:hypothetical protein ONZ45_g14258 [Pleurotus djamor]|nr:hypothetical protein ONZ45_g14258 [Pleurotus djamor]
MSAPPAPVNSLPPIPPIIAELTGPLLLGHFFNWGLFGALIVQTYVYYLAFPNDRLLPKTIVYSVLVIEVLQTVLATRDAFRNFGTGWGNMIDLAEVGWLWFSVPVLGSIISCMSQFFFAWRIWVLSNRQLFLPACVTFLSLVQGVAGIWTGIYAHFIGVFSEVTKHTKNTTIVWLGGTALCDVIIAASMIYFLSKSRTGFRQTNVLLTKLVRIVIETGLTCATFAVLDLILFLAFQETNYHLAPSVALSKLYSNSLLVVLNARVRMVNGRETRAATQDMTLSSTLPTSNTTLGKSSAYSDSTLSPAHRGVISVSVTQTSDGNTTELDTLGAYKKGGDFEP